MRTIRRGAIAAALLICMPTIATAATVPAAGPLATAAQIRAAHPSTQAATKIVFEKRDGEKAVSLLTVIMADDFLDIADGENEQIFDFKLKRGITVNRTTRRFSNPSLYATIGFRAFELNNRRMLGGALAAAKVTALPDTFKPFWAETELALVDQSSSPPTIERQAAADGTVSFRFEGSEVVRLKPSGEALTVATRKLFSRALRYLAAIHPAIIDQIVETGRLPATLVYTQPVGGAKTTVTLTLRSAEATTTPFPLPGDFSDELIQAASGNSTAAALNAVLPIVLQAEAGRYANGPRAITDYRKGIADAVTSGAAFQGLLLEFELLLQHGTASIECAGSPPAPRCYSLKEIVGIAAGDPRTRAFLEAVQIEAKDNGRAIELRRGIDRKGLNDTAALDIMHCQCAHQQSKTR